MPPLKQPRAQDAAKRGPDKVLKAEVAEAVFEGEDIEASAAARK